MDAGKAIINDIFNGMNVLEIPYYQRAYVWGETQLKRFLEDMEEISSSNKPYFLGSVILKQQITSTYENCGNVRTVIDGQQRLTTLTVFFKVYSLLLNDSSLFSNFQLNFGKRSIAINHNRLDKPFFDKIVELTKLEDLDNNNNINFAYNYFKLNIELNKLNYMYLLTKVLFVAIDLNRDEDEQQIFDTINSLGVKLTTAALLKNYLFNRQNENEYEIYWEPVFEKDNETRIYWDKKIWAGRFERTFIDLFFFAFLQIKIQDKSLGVSATDKAIYSKVDTLFDSYKNFISKYLKNDSKQLIVEIKDYASIFKCNFDNSILAVELTPEYGIERINALVFGLENTTLIPYILFILKNAAPGSQASIFEYLESYIMRRMVCHAITKNYNQLFTDSFISNKILTKNDLQNYINNKSDKINYMPSDGDLKNAFHSSKLVNKQSAGILYFIESHVRYNQMHATALLGLSNYSLEHLLPKKWRGTWPTIVDKNKAEEIDSSLLTLGNLAIIPGKLNTSVSNSDWKTKCEGKNNKSGLKLYASSLSTLSEYLTRNEWNIDTIGHRADDLYEMAKNVWNI